MGKLALGVLVAVSAALLGLAQGIGSGNLQDFCVNNGGPITICSVSASRTDLQLVVLVMLVLLLVAVLYRRWRGN